MLHISDFVALYLPLLFRRLAEDTRSRTDTLSISYFVALYLSLLSRRLAEDTRSRIDTLSLLLNCLELVRCGSSSLSSLTQCRYGHMQLQWSLHYAAILSEALRCGEVFPRISLARAAGACVGVSPKRYRVRSYVCHVTQAPR